MPDRIPSTLLLLGLLATAVPVAAQTPAGADPQTGTLRLSLAEAVDISLAPEGSVRLRLAAESIRRAEALAVQARAPLLPHIEAAVGRQSITRNLEAFGIRLNIPVPGFRSPVFVGPFNVFDARAFARQSLLDLGALRRHQAARRAIREAEAETDHTRDEVRERVARLYLAAARADAALEAADADVRLAEALLALAENMKEAGTGTRIETTRSRVQLAEERRRRLEAENDVRAARLRLLRELGLPLHLTLVTTEPLSFAPVDAPEPDQALRTALERRADWKAHQEREEASRLRHSAVRWERWPVVSAFAEYGAIGTGIDNSVPTRTYGVTVQLPVFDGGRREGRAAEAAAALRQERIRGEDLRREIELETRLALDRLRTAHAQVEVATEAETLAEQELAQARRRYEAGMASGIEVTEAQTRLQRAREGRIAAVHAHGLARLDLAGATGTMRDFVR